MAALPQIDRDAPRLLEEGFPYAQVSAIARADRFNRDGVYNAHKWWARRPPGVIRAFLLASFLPADTDLADFWSLYASDAPALAGRHIGDPFMGGATTLVEAARLGADVTGIDVDPLALLIAGEELAELGDPDRFSCAADDLLRHLAEVCGGLYSEHDGDGPVPLHFFSLPRARCEDCGTESLVFRSLVLARDVGKRGAVVRGKGQDVFCPDCRTLHHLAAGRKLLMCCGRRHRLDEGTYRRSRYECPGCGVRRAHDELCTGTLPRELVAVEETVARGRRRLRAPAADDHRRIAAAHERLAGLDGHLPVASLEGVDGGRPALYGFSTVAELFTARQKVVFASAFAWIDGRELDAATRNRLRLAVSNALSSNNVLCGYATDYGRLAPLFTGVRSYAMPVLGVELNPLHTTAGRGTLAATLRRVRQSLQQRTRRHVVTGDGRVEAQEFQARRATAHHVTCQSADRSFPRRLGRCDAIVTDPPYFDFIAYSDLSLVHRAWLWPGEEGGSLRGRPIYPVGDDPVRDFSTRLGRALAKAAGALVPGGTITFTFHSTNPQAWRALSDALRRARLGVTAVFPVWTDARAAAHAHPGNCEWDVVFTCRPVAEVGHREITVTVADWLRELGADGPAGNDIANLELGLQAAIAANSQEHDNREQGRADRRAAVQAGRAASA